MFIQKLVVATINLNNIGANYTGKYNSQSIMLLYAVENSK